MKPDYVVKILLIIVLLVVVGCGGPEPSPEPSDLFQRYQELSADHTALQNAHSTLLFNYEQLREVKKERDASLVKYSDLIHQYRELQTNYAVMEAQYNSMNIYYEELFAGLSSGMVKDTAVLEELNNQYQVLIERQNVITERLWAVNNEKVSEISDNLTEGELDIFYRGWNLWWGTFNE